MLTNKAKSQTRDLVLITLVTITRTLYDLEAYNVDSIKCYVYKPEVKLRICLPFTTSSRVHGSCAVSHPYP